jgi:hypothetical protein
MRKITVVVVSLVAVLLTGCTRPDGCYFQNKRGELWQVPCEPRRVTPEACFISKGGNLEQVPCPFRTGFR